MYNVHTIASQLKPVINRELDPPIAFRYVVINDGIAFDLQDMQSDQVLSHVFLSFDSCCRGLSSVSQSVICAVSSLNGEWLGANISSRLFFADIRDPSGSLSWHV